MSTDSVISMVAVLAVAVLLIIKVWGYQALKFKMDESAITNLLGSSVDENSFMSTTAISAKTNLTVSRVSEICARSQSIQADPQENQCWSLKR